MRQLTPKQMLLLKDISWSFVFLIFFLIAAFIYHKYGEMEHSKERRQEEIRAAAVPKIAWDDFRTGPLPDGTFEVFRKVQYSRTLVACYAIIDHKKNKAVFHQCSFVEQATDEHDLHRTQIVTPPESLQ